MNRGKARDVVNDSSWPVQGGRPHWDRLFVASLFVLGIVHWLAFFCVVHPASGRERDLITLLRTPSALVQRPPFGLEGGRYYNDSIFIHTRKLTAIQEAIRQGTLPYHLPGLSGYEMMPTQESPVGDRLFAVPYGWQLSPQVLLLAILDITDYIVVNWLLLYTVGFVGCLLIRRTYGLGPVAFAFLFLLVNFNGWITSNAATHVGERAGYFLTPFLALLFLQASKTTPAETGTQRAIGLCLALVLAAIWYQGSTYVFICWLTFLVFWGVVNWKRWRVTMGGLVAVVAMCASRILPAALTWHLATRPQASNPALGGYWAFDEYVDGLAVAQSYMPGQDWSSYNLYVSIFGLLAMVYLAVWAPFKGSRWVRVRPTWSLLAPILLIVLISFRHVKEYMLPDWIPLFNAVVRTARYMEVVLVFWIVVASINLQGAVEAFWRTSKMRMLFLVGLGLMGVSLANHSRLWRLGLVTDVADWPGFAAALPAHVGNDLADAGYIASVNWSLAISGLAVLVVLALLLRYRMQRS